jgi:hypothetical protein
MASTADIPKIYAVTHPSPSRADDSETLSSLSRLLVIALFAAAMSLQQRLPLNLDVSWLLVAGKRVLDGERLYVDIVEINPPMAVFAYLPAIVLARATGPDSVVVTDGLVLTLASPGQAVQITASQIAQYREAVRTHVGR